MIWQMTRSQTVSHPDHPDPASHDLMLTVAFTVIAQDAQGESLSASALRRGLLRRMADIDAPNKWDGRREWGEAVLPPADRADVEQAAVAEAVRRCDPLAGASAERARAMFDVLRAALNWHQARLDSGADAADAIDGLLEDFVAVAGGQQPRVARVPASIANALEAA